MIPSLSSWCLGDFPDGFWLIRSCPLLPLLLTPLVSHFVLPRFALLASYRILWVCPFGIVPRYGWISILYHRVYGNFVFPTSLLATSGREFSFMRIISWSLLVEFPANALRHAIGKSFLSFLMPWWPLMNFFPIGISHWSRWLKSLELRQTLFIIGSAETRDRNLSPITCLNWHLFTAIGAACSWNLSNKLDDFHPLLATPRGWLFNWKVH